ncbi:MAG: hypothetical protein CMJ78_07840 [Planctomycetaceae bacterium]|nr:hypothetical protein [Planctomycetaceae bacterium]
MTSNSQFRCHSAHICRVVLTLLTLLVVKSADAQAPPTAVSRVIKSHCMDCHEGESAEAGLDLSKLDFRLTNPKTFNKWVKIHDRVRSGEMPPKDAEVLGKQAVANFTTASATALAKFQADEFKRLGRVRSRRLTRREIERSLQDLLGIDIPLADKLPEESQAAEFSTVADRQSMSHFQLERHLVVVDTALDDAFRRAFYGKPKLAKTFTARELARRNPKRRCREPEMRSGQAVVWSANQVFYGRIPATAAPVSGWYRFKLKISGLKLPKTGGVWTTVRTGLCISSAPILNYVTAIEATRTPKTVEFDAWLPKGHMLEIRPGDSTIKKARFQGGQVGTGEGEPQNVPGIALDELTMERFDQGFENRDVRKLLIPGVPTQWEKGKGILITSKAPRQDVERSMMTFARRAFRRPVKKEEIKGYLQLAMDEFEKNNSIRAALRAGYRALLCSPRFLYLTESPGRLDDHAIASRLSYMLTGSTPDEQLASLANKGQLSNPMTLRAEADRLLKDAGGRQFIEDFAAEWLDMDQINFTQPDRRMFWKFDPIVQQTMLDETHTFLEVMLQDNLSVKNLIRSDFTFLNSRLARYYGIQGVVGDQLRRVQLKPEHRRGGVLTHGSILKVTANGTNTSPVVRGVWVSERLLGIPIAPPPDNVPAIEPDIRGATTIRQKLAKHRSLPACASCHVKIDAPGFALENFDPTGQWRDRYFRQAGRRRIPLAKINASYQLNDGREFKDIQEFQTLITAKPRRLAENVAEKLLVYGTGAPIAFADRKVVEYIAKQTYKDNHGFRSIVHGVITSPVFLMK